MREPAAIQKAKDLLAHLKGEHNPDALVILTTDEGLDLVDFLVAQNPDQGLLLKDAQEAHRMRDPAMVLDHFQLLGLSILVMDRVVH